MNSQPFGALSTVYVCHGVLQLGCVYVDLRTSSASTLFSVALFGRDPLLPLDTQGMHIATLPVPKVFWTIWTDAQ